MTRTIKDARGRPIADVAICGDGAGSLTGRDSESRFGEGVLAFLQNMKPEQKPVATQLAGRDEAGASRH
ncbi:hypothetical protein [Novosphingobium terrae]|uniref:hypothetical protein n=1 Tax=Novosphingobium terrae TaxID=2726189 RepID=UPI00198189D9|nr:hypothetical protein [Novosphingobium terrae]